jgi:hypothetical protein
MANHLGNSYTADRYERGVSTSNQPQHFVATTVWDWPLGKTVLSHDAIERAVLGGFKWSGIFQAFSGSPLALTENTAQTNPAQASNQPIINPNFSGSARVNGKWGKGAYGSSTYYGCSNCTTPQPSYIAPSTYPTADSSFVATDNTGPFMATNITNPTTKLSYVANQYYNMFSDASRTAPYNLYGPAYYQLDLAVVRSFPLHITESSKFDFRAEWYNVTNHTLFGIASQALGASTFGQVTKSGSENRKSAQFSARISF